MQQLILIFTQMNANKRVCLVGGGRGLVEGGEEAASGEARIEDLGLNMMVMALIWRHRRYLSFHGSVF